MTAEELIRYGYRVISRKFGILARIDRSDWKEVMAKEHAPWNIRGGRSWVQALGNDAYDHYRRCCSKDRIEVPLNIARKIPNSNHDTTGYVPLQQGEKGEEDKEGNNFRSYQEPTR